MAKKIELGKSTNTKEYKVYMQRSIKITYKRAYKEQANYYEIHLKNSIKFNFRVL